MALPLERPRPRQPTSGWFEYDDNIATPVVADVLDAASHLRGGARDVTLPQLRIADRCLSGTSCALCASYGIAQCAGHVATCLDNAVAVAFWSSLKRELLHRHGTGDQAERRSPLRSSATTLSVCTRALARYRRSSGSQLLSPATASRIAPQAGYRALSLRRGLSEGPRHVTRIDRQIVPAAHFGQLRTTCTEFDSVPAGDVVDFLRSTDSPSYSALNFREVVPIL
jgi:transposase InsO family protein